jgi:aminoglycoside phosphotransferase (APT) family kinase protein
MVRSRKVEVSFSTQPRIDYAVEKMSEFGKAGWVHGDAHYGNVMVFIGREDDAGGGVLLVDFDWPGRYNEVFYSHNMETQTIHRARDAKRLGVVKPEHDLEMMKYICRLP